MIRSPLSPQESIPSLHLIFFLQHRSPSCWVSPISVPPVLEAFCPEHAQMLLCNQRSQNRRTQHTTPRKKSKAKENFTCPHRGAWSLGHKNNLKKFSTWSTFHKWDGVNSGYVGPCPGTARSLWIRSCGSQQMNGPFLPSILS